jgi:membrane-associated protein
MAATCGAVTSGIPRTHRLLQDRPGIVKVVNPTSIAGILPSWLNAEGLVNSMGSWALLGIALIIFAECGILIGFFLPGDTLLFISGLLVAKGTFHVNVVVAIAILAVAAFVGNMVGYGIGYKAGPLVFERPNAKFFKKEYVEKSAAFFEKYGKVAVILARFVPVVRTVATVMAGASKMNTRLYTLYSAIGGVIWVTGVTIAGYFLGQIQFIADNVDVILVGAVVVVVLVSAVPAFLHLRQRKRAAEPN